MELYPFHISYVTKSPIWGGTRLLSDWGKVSENETVGESWELTVRKEEKSLILNGAYAGKTLESVLEEAGEGCLSPNYRGKEFPLLIKLIDACDKLSVQVHPDDEYAEKVENDRGKTEMWYIVEADPDAEIICGLNPGASREEFAKAVGAGDPESALYHCKVKAGETYFIPAGLTHAIGKGILIAEIQQNCDLTYRVFDYNRRGKDGSLRQLHVQKALDVVKPFTKDEIDAIRYERAPKEKNNPNLLADCRYFRVEKVCAGEFDAKNSFLHFLCLEGEGKFVCNGESYPVKKGDSYFLPLGLKCKLEGSAKGLMSSI